MARPVCPRKVDGEPRSCHFKPAGVPVTEIEEQRLTLDEFEALRLCDLEGLYLEDAAGRMEISRPTLSRILDSARKKVADSLVNGKSLRIEGGVIMPQQNREFECEECGQTWEQSFGGGRPRGCPYCNSRNYHRTDRLRAGTRGSGRGAGQGQNRGDGRRRSGSG